MAVLITGASGLLGHDMVYTFENAGFETIKISHKKRESYIALDLTTEEGIKSIAEMDFTAIIHTAAWRMPDQCMNDKKGAHRMNVWVSEQLAHIAKDKNVPMIYISTDYVFSGNNPPYTEESVADPVNDYGESKLLGEQRVLEISDNNISLRIPYLYGIRAGLEASQLLTQSIDALKSTTPWQMDHTSSRYPTYTGDVADASLFLLKNKFSGTFHFSGLDRLTRYEITEVFAHVLNRPMTNIVQQMIAPVTEAQRPLDSHLASDKIHTLGLPPPLPFKERIAEILSTLPI